MSSLNRWLAITGLLAVVCWWFPVEKPAAVLGRYSYPQFVFAVLTTGMFLTIWLVSRGDSTRRRILVFRALTFWLSGVIAVVGCELAAMYLVPPNNPFYTFNEGGVASDSTVPVELPYTRPPHLKWSGWSRGNTPRWAPDPKDTRWISFETDYEGFRNTEDLTHADLVFIGDSFTEGGNVANDETFVQLTAKAMNASVRNLGLFGYPPQAEFVVLKHYGLKCDPRVVIWQIFEGNDISDSLHFEDKMYRWNALGQPRFDRSNPPYLNSLWVQRSPTYFLFTQLAKHERNWFAGDFVLPNGDVRTVRFQPNIALEHHYATNGAGHEHPGWTPIAGCIRECARMLNQQNVHLVLVFIPTKCTVLGDAVVFDDWSKSRLPPTLSVPEPYSIATALARLCEESEVSYVDTTSCLKEATARRELTYIPSDTHLSVEGHRVVSEALVQKLQELNLP